MIVLALVSAGVSAALNHAVLRYHAVPFAALAVLLLLLLAVTNYLTSAE